MSRTTYIFTTECIEVGGTIKEVVNLLGIAQCRNHVYFRDRNSQPQKHNRVENAGD